MEPYTLSLCVYVYKFVEEILGWNTENLEESFSTWCPVSHLFLISTILLLWKSLSINVGEITFLPTRKWSLEIFSTVQSCLDETIETLHEKLRLSLSPVHGLVRTVSDYHLTRIEDLLYPYLSPQTTDRSLLSSSDDDTPVTRRESLHQSCFPSGTEPSGTEPSGTQDRVSWEGPRFFFFLRLHSLTYGSWTPFSESEPEVLRWFSL